MISQKITFSHNFLWVNFRRNFTFLLGLCLSIFIFNFNPASVFALYTPILSASVDQVNLQVNGNQVINSVNKTAEIPLNLTVNTNNKTGYTATLSSETENTALINITSTSGAKINSISSAGLLGDFSNNTWGYKFGASSNYAPIPALSSPAQILQTAGKTNGNELNQLNIGMKLADNLESGNYTNKLIMSFVSNPYTMRAIMTEGLDFNAKLISLETAINKIEHFKKSTVAPAASMNAVNIEDEESDYEIKLWLDPTDKTAYYYTETEKVYLNMDSSMMFYRFIYSEELTNILDIDFFNLDTSKVTNMYFMFSGMSNLTSLNLSNFDTSKVVNMSYMFYSMSNLTSLDVSNFNTSNVTDMSGMFSYVINVTILNLVNFDTSKVTNMGAMFSSMYNLTTLDLSNFDTSKVTDMHSMFSTMLNLTSLNLSNFDTSNVINMNAMFYGMSNLTSLDISNFDTSNVINMNAMFYGMSNLTSLNLSNFDTSNVINMNAMFYHANSLTLLDLSNFNTSNVISTKRMFEIGDEDITEDNLTVIYVNNDFNTAKLTIFSAMFKNRKKLRGGNGSYLSDPSTADKNWLRVDRPGVQGYFTRKP